jgi:membrane protease YdiL (CAAX protease family)
VLAGLAGLGYAVVYQRTMRLEMSVLAHFTVNAVHFLLFTYPALA